MFNHVENVFTSFCDRSNCNAIGRVSSEHDQNFFKIPVLHYCRRGVSVPFVVHSALGVSVAITQGCPTFLRNSLQ